MSNSGLISTVAFKLAGGLEVSVGCAGQALDWLKLGLGMARKEEEEEGFCRVVIVPAYGGLLCPGGGQMLEVLYWG